MRTRSRASTASESPPPTMTSTATLAEVGEQELSSNIITTSGKQLSPSIRKAGTGCLRGGRRKLKKKEQYAKIVLTKKKNAAKKVKQTIQECKQMAAETQIKLKAAVEELEQAKTRVKESENNFAMEQRKKDLDIFALTDEIDILRRNNQIMTALKTELKMQNKAYVELKEACT
jgi:hypothetical protein